MDKNAAPYTLECPKAAEESWEAVVEAGSSSVCMAQLIQQVGAVKAMNIKDKLFKKAGIAWELVQVRFTISSVRFTVSDKSRRWGRAMYLPWH